MLFRTAILFFFVVSATVPYQSNGLAINDLYNKYVYGPLYTVANAKDNNLNSEHGSLDFFGRDLLRQASKRITATEKPKMKFSKDTKGLDCNKTLSNGGNVDTFKSNIQAIYPGTKWCGDGNISKSYNDLGKFSKTDSCCREHDLCPDNMDAGATKYGLANTGLFTRSHCDCDTKFYECLKKANSFVSKSIGYTYFTVLGPQCFKQDYPISDCAEERKGKCVKYSTDQQGRRIYQWFDSPTF